MSHPYAPGATYDGSDGGLQRKGSVKAARERAQAEQAQYLSADYFGQPSRPPLPTSQYNVRPPTRPQANPTPPSSSGRELSPSPGPNWPLADDSQPAQESPPRQKGPPPQRPPRPSYVPSILDPTRPDPTLLAPPLPRTPGNRRREPEPEPVSPSEYYDDQLSPNSYYPSPNEHRPITTSSINSVSSLGSIPDFPVPNMPQSRKSQSLGPPPSARRGPSSYYSQQSFVSPIVEEAESHRSRSRNSHNSFASSNVIPNADGFYFDEDATPSEDDMPMASPSTITGSDRSSRVTDDGDQAGLVRHASLGKRGKPSLTTTKSVDSFDRIIRNNEKQKKSAVGQGIMAAGAAGGAFAAGYGNSRDPGNRSSSRPDSEALSSGTGLFPPSASESSESVNTVGLRRPMKSSPLARSEDNSPDSPVDPRVNQILGGLEKGGALGAGYSTPKTGMSLADRVGARRPPRLNVNAVRDAEARGSLTSLPDLIRRATRLASNLDRGKTASRMDMEMWEKGGGDKAWEAGQRRASSLSDILTSFPHPGIGTPTGERYGSPRPVSRWPSGLGQYEQHHDYPEGKPQEKKKQGRRCCGMPLWCFIVLMLILVLLVAAAVIVPVVLIVLPKQNGGDGSSSADAALAQCQQTYACENGGSSVVNPSGHCSCMCVNGFTGDHCTTESDEGCTTTTIGGRNATIGSAMPSLISTASDSFHISLSGSELLSLFSSNNLSCTAENALVTFSGVSTKKRSIDLPPPAPMPVVEVALENDVPSTPCPSSVPTVTPAPELKFRVARDGSDNADDAATSYGIVYDSAPASSNAYYSSYSSTATGSAAASATTSALSVSKKRVQFARIGVLFVLQESNDLSKAVTAQENLQTYFKEFQEGDDAATAATAVSLGNSFAIDLSQWHITLPNGTHVGHLVE
ncbi:hypothetical protein BK809_0005493 [Diplodia seriata]|uniref:EGF-like domain-containing protein n=1 Tax=Diplodia seriata TaxID=420778 RepID=A0A1S8BMK4_9PEZI|nr:hypothetical protein BK809_0005493 [Diplodia seriata]